MVCLLNEMGEIGGVGAVLSGRSAQHETVVAQAAADAAAQGRGFDVFGTQDEGRPGIVRNPQKNSLINCSLNKISNIFEAVVISEYQT